MEVAALSANAVAIDSDLEWLSSIIDVRLKLYFGQDCDHSDIREVLPPELPADGSVYVRVVKYYNMDINERLLLLLALCPHVKPGLLDVFFTRNSIYDRGFTEFGGVKGINHGGFLPTAETAAFLLSGSDLHSRFSLLPLFDADHFLFKHNILKLVPSAGDEPTLSAQLTVSREYLGYFITGETHKPDYSITFPAKRVTTRLSWDDLVLDDHILDEIEEIRVWIEHEQTLLQEWELGKTVKPGYRALFHGPPGTGKTLTACLLGNSAGLDVYRIDLSMVVSKYIGETEKNLANVFDQAINKRWILFFDEADALFGKRTQTSSSNDRYANQEVAYLLQRIEDFPGVVILATNLKGNIDEAFARRFQNMIYFPIPGPADRLKLWQQAFSGKCIAEPSVSFEEIAQKYEITGGAIINVLRYCAIAAMRRGTHIVLKEELLQGIRKEFRKEGKTI
jgi:AAA+ superfamily predicted ATPase